MESSRTGQYMDGSPIADQYVDGVPIEGVLYGWLKWMKSTIEDDQYVDGSPL